MVEMMNYFLRFFKAGFEFLFNIKSSDGYSLGYMVLGILIVGTVISATIGVVAVVSNSIERYSRDSNRGRKGD